MRHIAFRWSILLCTCAFLGCGSSSGIQSGIPADANTAPVNPTPDMGPDPKPAKKR